MREASDRQRQPAGAVRQMPVSLTGNFVQSLPHIPKHSLTGQTRAACAALRQVPVRLPECAAGFENSPSLKRICRTAPPVAAAGRMLL